MTTETADLAALDAAIKEVWDNSRFEPEWVLVSWGTAMQVARRYLSKRQYRRWRGRMRRVLRDTLTQPLERD